MKRETEHRYLRQPSGSRSLSLPISRLHHSVGLSSDGAPVQPSSPQRESFIQETNLAPLHASAFQHRGNPPENSCATPPHRVPPFPIHRWGITHSHVVPVYDIYHVYTHVYDIYHVYTHRERKRETHIHTHAHMTITDESKASDIAVAIRSAPCPPPLVSLRCN